VAASAELAVGLVPAATDGRQRHEKQGKQREQDASLWHAPFIGRAAGT